jgi:hypothetical protein
MDSYVLLLNNLKSLDYSSSLISTFYDNWVNNESSYQSAHILESFLALITFMRSNGDAQFVVLIKLNIKVDE